MEGRANIHSSSLVWAVDRSKLPLREYHKNTKNEWYKLKHLPVVLTLIELDEMVEKPNPTCSVASHGCFLPHALVLYGSHITLSM